MCHWHTGRVATRIIVQTRCKAGTVGGFDDHFRAPVLRHIGVRAGFDPAHQVAHGGIEGGSALEVRQLDGPVDQAARDALLPR